MSVRAAVGVGLALTTTGMGAPVDAHRAAQAALSIAAGFPAASTLERLEPVLLLDEGVPVLWLATFHEGGFAFIRADDRLPPVAGWSQAGTAPALATDADAIHPALRDWLELQRLDAAWARAADWTDPEAVAAWESLLAGQAAGREGESVPPLLTCTWDQGWPWNQFCPADAAGPGGHVWAGCVATAMAQLMYFWRWPDMGAGWNGYSHPVYGWQAADFGATTYDWDAMPDAGGSPTAALLQYHCGVAVEMDYSPWGSGAWVGTNNPNALTALESHFRYPACAGFIQHAQYPGEAWAERLAEEIIAGRPVLDSGYGSGGHAFILDGLQDGLFHVNWGWSGWYNGWFDVEALTPGGMEFSLWQGALVNVMADTAPVVAVPGQTVAAGLPFDPVELDQWVEDREDAAADLIWWVEAQSPLTATLDETARRVQVTAPSGWTGSASIQFCAMDPGGLWSCGGAAFAVAVAALPPAAIQDLAIEATSQGPRLSWTPPATDAGGVNPAVITGFAIHRSHQPWFAPGPSTQAALLPAGATTWTDPAPPEAPAFYRVVVLGP